MMNNNKILTVSYGTFSCTLEGFDDSFGTMKAIAEYFRDLASDDRYFGAEPPQPDAQMLAHIAQREISRRVDAREDQGRIVLSAAQSEDNTAKVTPSETKTPEAAPTEEQQADAAPTDTPALDQPNAEEMAAAETIQAAEGEEPVPSEEPDTEAAQTTATADAPDDADEDAGTDSDLAEAMTEQDDPDIVPSLPDDDVEAFFADAEDAPTDYEADTALTEDRVYPAEDELVAEDIDAPVIQRESIAEKLKRIRAVVSQQSGNDTPGYTEDEHAEAPAPDTDFEAEMARLNAKDGSDSAPDHEGGDVVAATLRDIEDALDTDDALSEAAPSAEEDDEEDVAALLSRLDAEDQAAAETVSDEKTEADFDLSVSFDEDEAEEDEPDLDYLGADSLLADDDADDLATDADAEPAMPSEGQSDTNFFGAEEDGPEAEGADDQARAPQKPASRTRVLKVKRATLEAAISAGKLEEYDAEDATALPVQDNASDVPLADRSTLSDEAEAELARELADLEAEIRGPAETEPTSVAQTDDDRKAAPNQRDAPRQDSAATSNDEEDDLDRLMNEADSQMDEPDSATRRDAFAHLRAAVAAKKADEAVGASAKNEPTEEPYRDDLASVVRPRRPESTAQRTERPSEARPAPLKLVAEQRIDLQKPAPKTPVRPRRVAAVVDNTAHDAPEDAESFEEFATSVGAHELPDLLEAAAAYLSFVEGHAQFSRPQLMTKVRQVEKENFTREDGLRSFGKLLREGKIEKLAGGRFQASDQIGFKPDSRAAG